MYSKTSLLFVLFCVVCSTVLYAQVKVSGVVKKEDGQAVASANVLAYTIVKKDTSLKKYTATDEQGHFQLTLPLADTLLVRVKALGYADGFWKPNVGDDNAVHNFVLLPKAIELFEVVVKSPPIVISKDTTTYNAKSFRDSTEQHVEDLLKKLPGINVDTQGKISYLGKGVEKVMVEGEDLFGQDYTLITRSLTALALDKIEVIDNYSDNKLLKGIEKSDKAAINLKIRKELKIRPFGNFGIGLGYKDRYNVSGTLLSLIHKLKFGVVGNTNNVGYKPIYESEYAMENPMTQGKDFNPIRTNLLTANPLTSIYGSGVDAKRVTFNTARQLGLTANLQLHQKVRLHAYSYLYRDDMKHYSKRTTNYFSDDKNIIFLDSSYQSQRPSLRFTEFKAEYDINTKTNVVYLLHHKKSEVAADNFYYTQNDKLTEGVPTAGRDNILGQSHTVSLTRRLNDKNAIMFTSNFTTLGLKRANLSRSVRYSPALSLPSGFDAMQQRIDEQQRQLKANVHFYSINKYGKYELNIGNSTSNDAAFSDISLKNQTIAEKLDGRFVNDILFKNTLFYADFKQNINIKRIFFMIDVGLQNISSQLYNQLVQKNVFKENRTLFQPKVGATYITGYGEFSFLLQRNQQLPAIQQLTDGYIQNNYRLFSASKPYFVVGKSNSYTLNYKYNSLIDFYIINLGVSWRQNRINTISEVTFDDYLSFTTYRPVEANFNQLSVNWGYEKLLTKLSTKVILQGNVSQSQNMNKVNGGVLTPTYSQFLTSKLYFISAFDGHFNFQFSTNFQTSRFVNRATNVKTSNLKLIQPEITLRYNPKKHISLFMTGEQLNWLRNNGQRDVVTLFDFRSVWIPQKAKSWQITLTLNNLLNNKAVYSTQINYYSMTQDIVTLQPRYFLLSASRAF